MTDEKRMVLYDDSLFKETTKELEVELRRRGIEREGPPDFDAVAARWKARRAVGEEPHLLRSYRFVIMVQSEDGQFRAYAPALEGCEARGDTPREARERLLQAVYIRLKEMLTDGQTPPSDEGAEIVDVVLPIPSQ